MADLGRPGAVADLAVERARLADTAVRERLRDLDTVLGEFEQSPDAAPVLDAFAVLLEVYGEALARVLDHADAATRKALMTDELVGHLLDLHDLRPPSIPARPEREPQGGAFIPVEALAFSASRAAS